MSAPASIGQVSDATAAPIAASTGTTAFAPRPVPLSWPATRTTAAETLERLTSAPFRLEDRAKQRKWRLGLQLLLDWLAAQPGATWQDRWLCSGADTAAGQWRRVPARWLANHGLSGPWRHEALVEALPVAIADDVLRPSLSWLVGGGPARGGLLVRNLASGRDPSGFARARDHCLGDRTLSTMDRSQVLFRTALILAAHGGEITDVTVGDVVQLLDAEADFRSGRSPSGCMTLYRVLHELTVFAADTPTTLRALRTSERTAQARATHRSLPADPPPSP